MAEVDEEAELREAFNLFDTDKNSLISPYEFKQAMFKLGEKLSDAEIQALFKQADLNGDGYVDYTEFKKMMS